MTSVKGSLGFGGAASVAPARALGTERLQFIDAARGTAMFFVFVSHFTVNYLDDAHWWARWLQTVSLIASPTFTLISGTLVGFLARTRPERFDALRIKLADRGLFLLTVGHWLIVGGTWPVWRGQCIFITDAIGVSMLIGPTLVKALSPARRLALAAAMYGLSWAIALASHPVSADGHAIVEALFGCLQPVAYIDSFPIVPWCCFDLAATVLGDRLGVLYLSRNRPGMLRLLVGGGAAMTLAGVALKSAYVLLALPRFGLAIAHPVLIQTLSVLTSPHVKTPPSLAYFLFWGGPGLCFVSAWLFAERRAWSAAPLKYASALGQSSLFMFVVQFYIYFAILPALRPYLPWSGAWPLYLGLSILLLSAAALEYHRRGYRRFLTVGVKWFCDRRASQATQAINTAGQSTAFGM